MKQKNRLIKLLQAFDNETILCDACKRTDDNCDECVREQRAEYLLANGVIVPPCKVGDTVFCLSYDEYGIAPIDKGEVYAVSINEGTNWFSVRYISGLRYDHTWEDFGRTVFLTREEAEKALKGAIGNDQP